MFLWNIRSKVVHKLVLGQLPVVDAFKQGGAAWIYALPKTRHFVSDVLVSSNNVTHGYLIMVKVQDLCVLLLMEGGVCELAQIMFSTIKVLLIWGEIVFKFNNIFVADLKQHQALLVVHTPQLENRWAKMWPYNKNFW